MRINTSFVAVPVLALCLAGAAAAQTVSQEFWVGAPISATGGLLSRAEVVAARELATRQPAAIPEQWVGSRMDAGIHVGAVRRSEVLADMALYARAGLLNDVAYQQFELSRAQVGRRIASYERMRNGMEFAQEVDRIEARAPRMARLRAFMGSGD